MDIRLRSVGARRIEGRVTLDPAERDQRPAATPAGHQGVLTILAL
ncbi:MAG: hypothetical protein R2752_03430 [Vicinamibacterales bacterium]